MLTADAEQSKDWAWPDLTDIHHQGFACSSPAIEAAFAITTNDGVPECPSGGHAHDASEGANTVRVLSIVGPARPMQSSQARTAAAPGDMDETPARPHGLTNLHR